MHSKIVHKHVHGIVNCTEQLTNKIHLSGYLVSVLISLNWSIIDEVTTRNATAFWPTLYVAVLYNVYRYNHTFICCRGS